MLLDWSGLTMRRCLEQGHAVTASGNTELVLSRGLLLGQRFTTEAVPDRN